MELMMQKHCFFVLQKPNTCMRNVIVQPMYLKHLKISYVTYWTQAQGPER